jgi:hypothetical protein
VVIRITVIIVLMFIVIDHHGDEAQEQAGVHRHRF